MANHGANVDQEERAKKCQRLLAAEPFKGLRAILDQLSSRPETLCQAVSEATSYKELLAKLGYELTLTNQIHVQDCYHRVGPAGGIRSVLPYHDIPTQSSLPTLVNLNSTVTTTPKAVTFFDAMLAALQKQLRA